jgi:8-hydroxy-5-deazaflavin:NADPH oxidoreductase
MNVTVIGTGRMARGIGTRLLIGGNTVTLVSREPEKAAALVAELQAVAKQGANVRVVPVDSPIDDPVVILAVAYRVVAEIIRQYGARLAGKIVVDITNPLNATGSDLAPAPGTSGAEEIAKLLPAGTSVVKAFNTTFAGTLVAGTVGGQKLDVFIAGDDARAKQVVSDLVEAGQLRAIDVGGLARARQLENLGLLGITLQFTQGTQFMSTWKFLA